jgi:transcriptional regulator GlxA family with amidase domain
MTTSGESHRPHRVGLLVFDGMKLLDVAGPAEVFAEANMMGATYELTYLSTDGQPVATSVGLHLQVDSPAEAGRDFDTVMVSGGEVFPRSAVPTELVAATRHLATQTTRMSSICTGAFVLGASGLLDGRSVTTHWKHAAALAGAYPRASVRPDAIFVKDGDVYTSAGVSAGIDLALAMVEEDHGPELTRDVARSLVVHMQRAGGQSQFSASLAGPAPRTPSLRQVVDHIKADPSAEHSVASLATRAHLSPRHLTRMFHEELSTTPARYLRDVRMDAARALLDAGHSVTHAAERSGFGTSETLRRAFVRALGVSPLRYQQRFRSTGGAGT